MSVIVMAASNSFANDADMRLFKFMTAMRFVTLARDTAKSKGFSGVFSNEFADEFAAAATDEENRYDALHRDSFRVRLVHRAASRDAMRGC